VVEDAMTGNESLDEEMPASAWTGWISFAGGILIIVGGFNVIEGLVALVNDDYYMVSPEGMAVNVPYSVLGWVQVVLGFLAVGIGVGLLRGSAGARVAGVLLAGVSSIVHLVTMATFPFWSFVVIVFNIMVIYAIIVHGREMKKLW
jgi:hypothetical protein